MPRPIPPALSVTLTFLRTAQGWTQKELARALGMSVKALSFYERGRSVLTRGMLETMVRTLGLEPEAIDLVLSAIQQIRASMDPPGSPVGPTPGERRSIEQATADVAHVARSGLTRSFQAPRLRQARQEAQELWTYLKGRPAEDRRVLVEGAGEYRSWALCERLCAESEKAAATDVGRAVELGELAVRVADLLPGEESWRRPFQGYAWAHLGNARRVASDLPGAEEAFVWVRKLWQGGIPGVPGLLPEGRVLDLEASLRRGQRRFGEALKLHDQALAVTRPADQGYILLNQAFTLEQAGSYERSAETLRQAALRVEARREPRLWFALRFQLTVNLCHLGRYAETETLIPEVRRLATQLGNDLDLIRVLWLEGRVAAGLGKPEEAIVALSRVREEFIARGIAYDAALASLELAAYHLERGRAGEVKRLAKQMAPIFQAQGIHREALAALRLFCRAAEQQEVTVEMARRLIEYLHLARHDPKLQFKEAEDLSL